MVVLDPGTYIITKATWTQGMMGRVPAILNYIFSGPGNTLPQIYKRQLINNDTFGLPPTQDSSHKWRFRLGFPTKRCFIILVVTASWAARLDPTDTLRKPK